MVRWRRLAAGGAIMTMMAAGGVAAAAARDFENPASHDPAQQFGSGSVQRQDTPTDPDYDQSEPDTANQKTSSSIFDERFDLFGFPSQLTQSTTYKEGPNAGKPMVAGFNAAGAWKVERGRGDVVVAILDTGVKWATPGLRDKVHLNTGELPLPEGANGQTDSGAPLKGYDLNRNGVVDVDDYANDPRVKAKMPSGEQKPTGEDLIHAFSDGTDADHNGFVDDVAGWDFFDDDNDPYDASSYFAAENHGTGRAENAVEQGNDGQGSIGVCPHCQFLPVRIWDTFVSDGNTFAMGIAYATDNGARVIEGANGSTYHSAFAEAASEYAYDHGVAQVYSGDDLNTGNHNWPANYNHTMEIQGTVPDTLGLSQSLPGGLGGLPIPIGTQAPVGTFFRGANITQYGGHSSISLEGSTGSENTAKAAGAAGLVVSAALDKGISPSPDEVREILEQTAEDVTPGNTSGSGTADPSQEGWDSHFGYGRANLGAAVALAQSGKLPPEAAIYKPDWYAPLTAPSVRITGLARARFATAHALHWKLEWGTGDAPKQWTTASQGDSRTSVSDFGSIDLNRVRAALAAAPVPGDPAGPTFGSSNPYKQQFTVRLLVSGSGIPTTGMDRKTLVAFTDPTLRPGYPRRMGTGGEAQIRYANLNGDNVPELIVPGEDGVMRALEPNGHELKGWPAKTGDELQAVHHLRSPGLSHLPPPRDPLRGPAIADIDGDGRPEIIDTAGQHLYVWEANGHRRKRFPKRIDPAFCRPQDETQPLHHRKCGFVGSPAIAHLEGRSKPPDIVAAALDGHVYAWRNNGKLVPGYPVNLVDPGEPPDKQMLAESIADPAIGDLNGDGRDDIVVSSNEEYDPVNSNPSDVQGGFTQAIGDVLANVVGGSSRVYAINGATGKYMPGWPIKLNGGLQNEFPLIGPGHDAELMKLDGKPVVVVSTTGGVLAEYAPDGSAIRSMQQSSYGSGSDATDQSAVLNLFESASIGDVLGNGGRALVKYGVTLGQVENLALPGQNFPYNHLIGAYDASTANPLDAWPRVTDDYQFLSSSNIVKVDPSSHANQVLAGTGLGLLHAYDGATGKDAPGFPKQTGGWLFSPAPVSSDGRIAGITREGYLFEWRSRAPACQPEWPTFRHDLQSTGNYDADGTPPAAPTHLKLVHHRRILRFTSPGDDGFCGRAASYRVQAGRRTIRLGKPVAGGKTLSRKVKLPKFARTLTVAAVDEAGNVGQPRKVRLVRRGRKRVTG